MSRNNSSLPLEGPNAGDIGRIWLTIQQEFMKEFTVQIRPFPMGNDQSGLVIELVNDGPVAPDGAVWVNVWSSKTFNNPLHLISTGQLFDLLITGYRCMERYFERGEAFAPTRRPR